MNMTRRTWFRTITGAFATLATGLGLRKAQATQMIKCEFGKTRVYAWSPKELSVDLVCWIRHDGERVHFTAVNPETGELEERPTKWLTYDLKKPTETVNAGTLKT